MTEAAVEPKTEEKKEEPAEDAVVPLTEAEVGLIRDSVKTQQFLQEYNIAGRVYEFGLLSSRDEEDWKLSRAIYTAALIKKVKGTDEKSKFEALAPEVMKLLEAPLDLFDQREVVKKQLKSIDGVRVSKEEIENLFDSGAISSEILNTFAIIAHGHRTKFIDLVTRSISSSDNLKK